MTPVSAAKAGKLWHALGLQTFVRVVWRPHALIVAREIIKHVGENMIFPSSTTQDSLTLLVLLARRNELQIQLEASSTQR